MAKILPQMRPPIQGANQTGGSKARTRELSNMRLALTRHAGLRHQNRYG